MSRACAALLAVLLLGFGAPDAGATGWHSWQGRATDVFRAAQYDRGEWVFTNGLWQAQGANADGLNRTDYYAAAKPSPVDPTHDTFDVYNALTYDFFGAHRAAHNGDYQLPNDPARWPDGTADLAEVRLAVEHGSLYVRFLWNAMPRPDAQVATLTFGSAASPLAPWPRNAGVTGHYDTALTVWGSGAELSRPGAPGMPADARAGEHVTEARVPLSALPPGPWTLQGGAGLADPAAPGRYWTVPAGQATATTPGRGGPLGSSNVWSLLFSQDQPWSFDELEQSRELSAGAVNASAVADPSLLTARATRLAPLQHGDLSRLLVSSYTSGDGISRDSQGALGTPQPPPGLTLPIANPGFNVSYFYRGRLQPYAMHVPQSYDGRAPRPLVVYLHGYTGLPEEPFYNPTGLVQAVDAKGWLLASALGRGDWFYRGGTPGDLDVLEVIRDVSRHYRVDPDRIYLMGHSMGGYGTNNLATHHPDLFAAVAPAEGTDSADLSANLRNTPWFEMTAEEDLDTQAKAAKALYGSLSAAGYEATLLDYRLKIHEYSSIYDTLPRLLRFFDSHHRVRRPAVVSWTRPVGQDRPDLGLVYDGAWWLRDVRPAAGVTRPTVTAETMALPHVAPAPAAAVRIDRMVDEGGPTGRTGAELFQTVPATGSAPVVPGELRVTARGAAAATVRLADAGLATAHTLVVRTDTDGPLALTLQGSGARGAGTQVLAIPPGRHVVRVSPHAGSAAGTAGTAAAGGDRALPATGGLPAGGLAASAGAAAALGGLALGRRRRLRLRLRLRLRRG